VSEPEIRETWPTVELPILRAIVRAQQNQEIVWKAVIDAVPDLDQRLRQTTLFWLHDAEYITATVSVFGDSIQVRGATEKTLRLTGAWPTPESELARLIALLDERIASAEGDEKTKLQRLRDALVGMGQGTAAGVLAGFLRQYLGI
jgi:hypothetical protein